MLYIFALFYFKVNAKYTFRKSSDRAKKAGEGCRMLQKHVTHPLAVIKGSFTVRIPPKILLNTIALESYLATIVVIASVKMLHHGKSMMVLMADPQSADKANSDSVVYDVSLLLIRV